MTTRTSGDTTINDSAKEENGAPKPTEVPNLSTNNTNNSNTNNASTSNNDTNNNNNTTNTNNASTSNSDTNNNNTTNTNNASTSNSDTSNNNNNSTTNLEEPRSSETSGNQNQSPYTRNKFQPRSYNDGYRNLNRIDFNRWNNSNWNNNHSNRNYKHQQVKNRNQVERYNFGNWFEDSNNQSQQQNRTWRNESCQTDNTKEQSPNLQLIQNPYHYAPGNVNTQSNKCEISKLLAPTAVKNTEQISKSENVTQLPLSSPPGLESANNCDKTSASTPKISLIPLNKLLAPKLSKVKKTATAIRKPICPVNVVTRRRTVSGGLDPDLSSKEIVDRVSRMDKASIQQIINSSGGIYDEALLKQADKRLRDQVRKELKTTAESSRSFEERKDQMKAITDEIVDSNCIPNVVLHEIEKALDVNITGMEKIQEPSQQQTGLPSTVCRAEEPHPTDNNKQKQINQNHTTESINSVSNGASSCNRGVQKFSHDLKSRLKVADNIKSKSPNKSTLPISENNVGQTFQTVSSISAEHYLQDTNSEQQHHKDLQNRSKASPSTTKSCNFRDEHSSKYQNLQNFSATTFGGIENCGSNKQKQESLVLPCDISSEYIKTASVSARKDSMNSQKQSSKRKRHSHKKRKSKRKKRKLSKEVILGSSCTSSSSSSTSDGSSSSSSSSSGSSSDSDSSTKESNKRKLRFDAQNVVKSFEQLILPNLNEKLGQRYRQKFSKFTYTKMHFITCVCTSPEYNTEKFSKSEVANIQRNLKSKDYSIALEFLMREIGHVYAKQKETIRLQNEKNQKKLETVEPQMRQKIMPNISADVQKRGEKNSNRIEAAVVKSKSANAAENVHCVAAESVQGEQGREQIKTAMQSTRSKHQSLNEPTLTERFAGGRNTDNAQIFVTANANDKLNKAKNDCTIPKATSTDRQYTSNGVAVGHQELKFAELTSMPLLTTLSPFPTPLLNFNNDITNNYVRCSLPTVQEQLQFPEIDLQKLKQQTPYGDIIVQKFAAIDLNMIEMQKRKMFIDEFILKLHKDRMGIDLEILKLQNDKLSLLSNAMMINAASVVADINRVETPVISSGTETVSGSSAHSNDNGTKPVPDHKDPIQNIASQLTATNKQTPPHALSSNFDSHQIYEVQHNECKDKSGPDLNTSQRCTESSPKLQENNWENQSNGVETMSTADPKNFSSHLVESTNRISHNSVPENLNSVNNTPGTNLNGQIKGITSPITNIRVHEEFLIASSEDGHLYLFDMKTLEMERKLMKHTSTITGMCLRTDDTSLFTISLDGCLKISDLHHLETRVTTVKLQEPLQSLDVEWNVAFIGTRWGNVIAYDMNRNPAKLSPVCSLDASIVAVKATKEGPRKVLIVAPKGNFVQIRDARSGLLLRSLDMPKGTRSCSLLLEENCFYCGTMRKPIHKFDFVTGEQLSKFSAGHGAVSLQIYKNKYLIAGCYDGFVYILEQNNGTQVGRFPGSGKLMLALEVAGDKIITSAKDCSMQITDIPAILSQEL